MNQSQEQNNVDGFESDIEEDKQQISPIDQFHEINQKDSNSQNKLLTGRPIISEHYSLYPDIATGWNGPQKYSHPIPITVEAPYFDNIFSNVFQSNLQSAKICYLGPRYDNTFFAWYKMPFQFPYSHLQPPTDMKFTNRPFIGQHEQFTQKHIVFNSLFESGNLDCVVCIDEHQYDLYLRVDSNTKGHFQWFYFTVQNLRPYQQYRLNICNMQKQYSLYSKGMKPFILSQEGKKKSGKQWEQKGKNIRYEKTMCRYHSPDTGRPKTFYNLSFDISTNYPNDTLRIAYCVPYTYSDLLAFLKDLKKKNAGKRYYNEGKLCRSLGGLNIPLITVTDDLNEDIESKTRKLKKKCIVLAARVHPGESNSSFLMEGLLTFLLSNNKYARHLRSSIIFKIVPMLNPDGVAFGNHRTGLSGKDFNRQYHKPDPAIFPQVANLKKLVADYKKKFGSNFLMFIDFHGHAVKKNIFMYGPQYNLAEKMYYEARILPRILSKQTKMFRYYSCIFRIQSEKKTTARAIFLYALGISLSYTLEISNFCYYDTDELKSMIFKVNDWLLMGNQLGYGLYEYLSLVQTAEMMRAQKIRKRQLEKTKEKNKETKNVKSPERKKEPRRGGKIKTMNLKNYQQKEDSDDEDLMNYIYKEIKETENQRKKFMEEMKEMERVPQQEEEDHSESDQEQQDNDLDDAKINFLYQCIKKRRRSDVLQTNLLSEIHDLKTQNVQNSNTEYIEKSNNKHRRVESVKINRSMKKKASFHLKQPSKIMIGTTVENQYVRIMRKPEQFEATLREHKQKPKSFQEFIETQRSFKKEKNRSCSNPKIYGRFTQTRLSMDYQRQSQIVPKCQNFSPDKQKLNRYDEYQKKKVEIYKQIQKKRAWEREALNSSETCKKNNGKYYKYAQPSILIDKFHDKTS